MHRLAISLVTAALFLSAALAVPAGHAAAPTVTAVTPSSHSVTAPVNGDLTVQFASPLSPASVSASAVSVYGRWTGPMTATVSLEDSNRRIRIDPGTDWMAGEWVTAVVARTVTDAASSDTMLTSYTWNFFADTEPGSLQQTCIDTILTRQPWETWTIQLYGAFGGDLNGDGYSDLTAINEQQDDIRVFLNDGAGNISHSFTSHVMLGGSFPSPNEGADFDHDGDIDLAVGHTGLSTFSLFTGTGAGTFVSPSTAWQTGGQTRGLDVIDFNGDGWTDVITANVGSDQVTVIPNAGGGTFDPPVLFPTDASGEWSMSVADADGDGIQDAFVGALNTSEMLLLLGDGVGGFTLSDRTPVFTSPWMTAVGDVNGDGYVDVVGACTAQQPVDGRVMVVLGDGAGGFGTVTEYPEPGYALAIDLGDLDGDGDLDMVSSHYLAGEYGIWENDGTGSFIRLYTLPASVRASCAILHDRDRDGDLDITGTDEETDEMFIFQNPGPQVGVDPPLPPTGAPLLRALTNPTAPPVRLGYANVAGTHPRLEVYDILGRRVAQVPLSGADGGVVEWDGRDKNGRPAPAGIYFLRIAPLADAPVARVVLTR